MESVARSEYCARNVSPTLVLRAHYTVSSSVGLVGFRHERRRVRFYVSRIEPLSEFHLPPEY